MFLFNPIPEKFKISLLLLFYYYLNSDSNSFSVAAGDHIITQLRNSGLCCDILQEKIYGRVWYLVTRSSWPPPPSLPGNSHFLKVLFPARDFLVGLLILYLCCNIYAIKHLCTYVRALFSRRNKRSKHMKQKSHNNVQGQEFLNI